MKTMFTILTLALIVGSAFGQSAELHKAAYSSDLSEVREILPKGVDPDDRDSGTEKKKRGTLVLKQLDN